MSLTYRAVGWNRQKIIYDTILFVGLCLYLSAFIALNSFIHPFATIETILIRAFGTASIILLHLILSIGPLTRLNRKFLPLLYNRRHLGVMLFFLALAHGLLSLIQFHGFGNMNPLASLFLSNTDYLSIRNFPFQVLGFFALTIFFVMAATSHDFWLKNLTPPVWKFLHMMVYLAYVLVIGHVVLGFFQSETNFLFIILTGVGIIWIVVLHLIAGFVEMKIDFQKKKAVGADGFVRVCYLFDIEDGKAKVTDVGGERVAIFRYGHKLSAVSNVCQHQNGPLGDGRVVDGKVICPWHGYEYQLTDGCAPAPFKEKISTYNLRLIDNEIFVNPTPNPPGTKVDPVSF